MVDFIWGTDGLNKTGVDYFNASQIGTVHWDSQFDLSTAENQQHAYDFCDLLMSQGDLLYATPENSVTCWLYDFEFYLRGQGLSYPLIMPEGYKGDSTVSNG